MNKSYKNKNNNYKLKNFVKLLNNKNNKRNKC